MDLSETIAASDLKVGRYRQLIGLLKLYEYTKGQGHFLTLAQGNLHMNFFLRTIGPFSTKFYM